MNPTLLKKLIAEWQLGLRMPSFKKTFAADRLDDVIAYITQWSSELKRRRHSQTLTPIRSSDT